MGYLYQAKWALLEILTTGMERPDQSISLERLEDIAWEDHGTPVELLQLKHHVAAPGIISDVSEDLWRTMRVWMDSGEAGNEEGPSYFLITTQAAALGSALEALRPGRPDPNLAETLLVEAARTSNAVATQGARERFLRMTPSARQRFIARIRVFDASPDVSSIDTRVRARLLFSAPRTHEAPYEERLWTWWYRVVLQMLRGQRDSVSPAEVAAKMSDLRDDFTRERLPTLVDRLRNQTHGSVVSNYEDYPFVHQMRWVDAPPTYLEKAIIDYYRAVTQSGKWLDSDLVTAIEIEDYEDRLRDEWDRQMAWVAQELPAGSGEQAKVAAGSRLLRKILDETDVRIRLHYDEPFYMRGKYHDLADHGKVGWHPDFVARLQRLLGTEAS